MNLVPPFPVILVTVFWLILPSTRSINNTTGSNEDEHQETMGKSRTTDWSAIQQQPVVTPKMEIIDSPDDIRPIVPSDGESQHVRSSIVFFSASLSIFAAIGIILFFRKCVTCPSRNHHHRHHIFEASEPHPPPAQLVNLMPILTNPNSPVPVTSQIQEELLYLRGSSEGEF